MEYKIPKIKEFLKNGAPQFEVIARHEAGKTIELFFESASEELDFKYHESVKPTADEGIIKKIKRISDNQEFSLGQWIDCPHGSGFIVFFSEDRVHCSVATMEKENGIKRTIEANELEFCEVLGEADLEELGLDEDNDESDSTQI